MTRSSTLRRLLAASTVALSLAMQAQAADLQVGHAWSRGTVVGQQAGGAFLTVKNGGTAPDRLLGASTSVADHVEMHTMKLEGDVMRMREVEAIDVPAGQSVALEPGKLHLMLMGLKVPLKVGSSFPLVLKFEKAGEVKVDVSVESGMPAGHDMKH